jgi:ankyrin repeat protein
MEQRQKPIRGAMQKAKSLFSGKAKPEGARRLNEKEQKELNDRLFAAIWDYKKLLTDEMQIETHIVARYTSRSRIRRLLRLGADVDAKDSGGETPLTRAAWKGDMDICKILIENGANLEAKDAYWGDTALMLAARNGNQYLVKYLVSRGADVNARNNNGETPLVLAVGGSTTKEWKTVRVLLQSGANQLGAAFMHARFDVAELLKNAMMNQLENVIGKESFALFMRSFRECTA